MHTLTRAGRWLGAATGHVAVHVEAGVGGTVAALNDLLGDEASSDLRPAALGLLVGGVAPRVGGGMGNAGYLGPPPFSLLINLDQHNAQYVSWQIIPLVGYCY
jgi:hypothetical protein